MYMRHLYCDCGGEMTYITGAIADFNARLPYAHRCESCGSTQNTSETYPHKFYEETEDTDS